MEEEDACVIAAPTLHKRACVCIHMYMYVYVHAYSYVYAYVYMYEHAQHNLHCCSNCSPESVPRRRMGRVYNIKTIQKNSIDTQRNGEGIQKKKSIATKTDGGGGSQKTTVKKPAKKQKRTKSTSGVGAAVLQRGWLGGVLRLVAV